MKKGESFGFIVGFVIGILFLQLLPAIFLGAVGAVIGEIIEKRKKIRKE